MLQPFIQKRSREPGLCFFSRWRFEIAAQMVEQHNQQSAFNKKTKTDDFRKKSFPLLTPAGPHGPLQQRHNKSKKERDERRRRRRRRDDDDDTTSFFVVVSTNQDDTADPHPKLRCGSLDYYYYNLYTTKNIQSNVVGSQSE